MVSRLLSMIVRGLQADRQRFSPACVTAEQANPFPRSKVMRAGSSSAYVLSTYEVQKACSKKQFENAAICKILVIPTVIHMVVIDKT